MNKPLYLPAIGLNFYRASIILYSPVLEKEVSFPGNEWYFHCAKLFHVEYAPEIERMHEHIRKARDPAKAKELGRHHIHLGKSQRRDWDQLHAPVAMLTCNLAKYGQNPHCLEWLASTGLSPLVEHRRDAIWGDNLDGTGMNLQGRILEVVRARLC